MIIAPERRSGNHKCCRCNQPNQCELHIHHVHRLISAFAAARRSSFGIFPPQTGLLPLRRILARKYCARSMNDMPSVSLSLLMQHRKGSRQRLHIFFGLRCRFSSSGSSLNRFFSLFFLGFFSIFQRCLSLSTALSTPLSSSSGASAPGGDSGSADAFSASSVPSCSLPSSLSL